MAIEAHLGMPIEEFVDGQRFRMIAEGAFGVEFDEKICSGLGKHIFAGNLFSSNGGKRHFGLVTQRTHGFGGTQDVGVAKHQVQIGVLPKAGIAITSRRENGPLGQQDLDVQGRKTIEHSKQFPREAQREQSLRAGGIAELLANFGGYDARVQLFKPLGKKWKNALLFREHQQMGPVQRLAKKVVQTIRVNLWTRTLQQQWPLSGKRVVRICRRIQEEVSRAAQTKHTRANHRALVAKKESGG